MGGVAGETAEVEQVRPVGLEVAVYEVIADPPSEEGALQATVTAPLKTAATRGESGELGAAVEAPANCVEPTR